MMMVKILSAYILNLTLNVNNLLDSKYIIIELLLITRLTFQFRRIKQQNSEDILVMGQTAGFVNNQPSYTEFNSGCYSDQHYYTEPNSGCESDQYRFTAIYTDRIIYIFVF
jgi:hypothetical protein